MKKTQTKAEFEAMFKIWEGMLSRCYNHSDKAYKYEGARGIEVCKEWHDFETFNKWAIEARMKSLN